MFDQRDNFSKADRRVSELKERIVANAVWLNGQSKEVVPRQWMN